MRPISLPLMMPPAAILASRAAITFSSMKKEISPGSAWSISEVMKVAESKYFSPLAWATHSAVVRMTPPTQKPSTFIVGCLVIFCTASAASNTPFSI